MSFLGWLLKGFQPAAPTPIETFEDGIKCALKGCSRPSQGFTVWCSKHQHSGSDRSCNNLPAIADHHSAAATKVIR